MRVAAIDCGTNATRMLVADVTPAGVEEVSRRLIITRMGERVDATGVIGNAALRRVGRALSRHVTLAAELGVERMGVLATSAARDARNTPDLVRLVEATTGVEPAILSGCEEAAATHAGALDGLAVQQPALVVDLGGGSTEFAIEHGGELVTASLDVGSVRLTERILHSDPPLTGEVSAAITAIDAALAPIRQRFSAKTRGADAVASVVAVGGTALTLAALQHGFDDPDDRRLHGLHVTRAQIDQAAEDLVFAPSRSVAELPAVTPGREDVIGAGALILSRILWLTGTPTMVASRHDLLDDLARRLATAPSPAPGAATASSPAPGAAAP